MKRKPAETENSEKKAFDAACAYLSRRAHSRKELEQKLDRKGFGPEAVERAMERLCKHGYINDGDVARRWAEALVRDRCWGKARVAAYLGRKGISRQITEQVQQETWQAFSEEDVARKAVGKRFGTYEKIPPQGKVITFLKSRGFSTEVIYKVTRALFDSARSYEEF